MPDAAIIGFFVGFRQLLAARLLRRGYVVTFYVLPNVLELRHHGHLPDLLAREGLLPALPGPSSDARRDQALREGRRPALHEARGPGRQLR